MSAGVSGDDGAAPLGQEDAIALFRAVGALREGHFILSSGLRSALYAQCALAMAKPRVGGRLCAGLAAKLRPAIDALAEADRPTLVVSPAMGGVIVGYETARRLGLDAIFMERPEGVFTLRRDFAIPPGAACLMVEDVITTGKSSRECIAAIEAAGGRAVLAACLVDRTNGRVDLGAPLTALVAVDAPTYEEDNLPPELAAIPAVKPGSRR